MGKSCSTCAEKDINQQEVVIKNANYRDETLSAAKPVRPQQPCLMFEGNYELADLEKLAIEEGLCFV